MPTSFGNPEVGWVILSSAEVRIKAKIEEAGKPLKEWDVNIYRGILTGFNEAFIIDGKTKNELIEKSPESAEIIRPLLRGQDIKRYSFEWRDLWLINPHNGVREKQTPRINVEDNYRTIYEYLIPYSEQLIKRQDKGDHWTNLRNCAYLEEFDRPKIIWGNLNLQATFCLSLDSHTIIAPCNMLTSANNDLSYLLGILNSSVTTYFMRHQGYSREGGYVEYKRIFIEQLSIPTLPVQEKSVLDEMVEVICKRKASNLDIEDVQAELNKSIFVTV